MCDENGVSSTNFEVLCRNLRCCVGLARYEAILGPWGWPWPGICTPATGVLPSGVFPGVWAVGCVPNILSMYGVQPVSATFWSSNSRSMSRDGDDPSRNALSFDGDIRFCCPLCIFCCCRAEFSGISHTGSSGRFSNCWICAFDKPLFAGVLPLCMCCLF